MLWMFSFFLLPRSTSNGNSFWNNSAWYLKSQYDMTRHTTTETWSTNDYNSTWRSCSFRQKNASVTSWFFSFGFATLCLLLWISEWTQCLNLSSDVKIVQWFTDCHKLNIALITIPWPWYLCRGIFNLCPVSLLFSLRLFWFEGVHKVMGSSLSNHPLGIED